MKDPSMSGEKGFTLRQAAASLSGMVDTESSRYTAAPMIASPLTRDGCRARR